MTMQETITNKIQAAMNPLHLEVENESHMHNVPAGSESHFKILVGSDQFDGQMLIKRHSLLNTILSEELSQIHAMALHTMTPDEWAEKGAAPSSPPCEGGGK